jgi:uncharacterized membrane protein YeiH
MEKLTFILELFGTVAFAISGATTAIRKNMDILGVCVLGLVTAIGGGITRDILLGALPPAAFINPVYLYVGLATALVMFVPAVRRALFTNHRVFDLLLLLSDSVGLGIFTVVGVGVTVAAGHGTNMLLCVFLGVLTGVGGGVIRDVLAGDVPYIFVKHIYALAAAAGALVCCICVRLADIGLGYIAGFAVVFVLRLCAAHFHWDLPKARNVEEETK